MEGIIFETNKRNKKQKELTKRVAIQISVFYLDAWEDIMENLKKIKYSYDLFIETNSSYNKNIIEKSLKHIKQIKRLESKITSVEKEDIYSFFSQMNKSIHKYDYALHLSSTEIDKDTQKTAYYNLLGTEENIESIFYRFENEKKLGIIYPEVYKYPTQKVSDELASEILLRKNQKYDKDVINFSGSMFWVKVKSIYPFFEMIKKTDFNQTLEENL